ncbi:hypothetical protein Fcan01_18423 [Folsomia candida]|uniref:Uncharacterized protein n=1 Tax=Folsomia candida TaxID=158441 RepID=A0A226DPG1_FOLCA|nr:hypothetical protein Fcan01_18423 [Folsomia candida]
MKVCGVKMRSSLTQSLEVVNFLMLRFIFYFSTTDTFPPRVAKSHKLSLLNMIKQKKSVLFGNFFSDLDNQAKINAWNEEKRDNKTKTGKGGGREKVLDDMNFLILDIIGKDSVAVDGLNVGESGAPANLEQDPDIPIDTEILSERADISSTHSCTSNRPNKRPHLSQNQLNRREETIKKLSYKTNYLKLRYTKRSWNV